MCTSTVRPSPDGWRPIRYFPGKFFNAALDKASTDNERCAYLVRDDGGRSWVMVQVAGLIARRIVCRVEEGDTLARGRTLRHDPFRLSG